MLRQASVVFRCSAGTAAASRLGLVTQRRRAAGEAEFARRHIFGTRSWTAVCQLAAICTCLLSAGPPTLTRPAVDG